MVNKSALQGLGFQPSGAMAHKYPGHAKSPGDKDIHPQVRVGSWGEGGKNEIK